MEVTAGQVRGTDLIENWPPLPKGETVPRDLRD